MWIRCAVCDELFEGFEWQICCSSEECKNIYKSRKRKEKRDEKTKRLEEIEAKHQEFVRLNAEAKAVGMSYGVYTEMLRQKENKLTVPQSYAIMNMDGKILS